MKVLISPGFGAGFSTWNEPEMATDKRLIEAFERGVTEEEFKQVCEDCGYENVYLGGFDHLEVVNVSSGTQFYIDVYDGYERLVTPSSINWHIAE